MNVATNIYAFVIGATLAVLACVTVEAVIDRRRRRQEAELAYKDAVSGALTGDCRAVVWRKNQYEKAGMYGRIEWIDDDHLTIDDGYDFVTLRRIDIEEMG